MNDLVTTLVVMGLAAVLVLAVFYEPLLAELLNHREAKRRRERHWEEDD